MTLHVALNHQSRYEFDRAVQMGPQAIRLRPAPHSRTAILSYSLKIEPEGYVIDWQQDPYGNFVARVMYPEKVKRFFVEVDLVADMVARNPFDFFLEPEAERYPFGYEPLLKKDLEPYLAAAPAGPMLAKWLRSVRGQAAQPTMTFLAELSRRLQADIKYTARLDSDVQPPEDTLTLKSGSSRDSAWLLVQMLRHLGIAARFVSGYLIQLAPDVKALDGVAVLTDFTDLHAWAEAYLPGAGWVGLDPTSGLLAGEGHIPLACTPHPIGAAPIVGVVEECETRFEHSMSVVRAVESPPVTKPYSDSQWRAIDELGQHIQMQLQDDDVRLTIGSKPTFVARDNPDAAPTSTAAPGPAKRQYAADLVNRLRARFAPHGVLHCGHAPLDPAERSPAWAFALHWRRDGEPLWSDAALLASEEHNGATTEQARALLAVIAQRLGLAADAIVAAPGDSATCFELPLTDGDGHTLAVEARAGKLCVILPRVAELDGYMALLAAIEEACVQLTLPVRLEGYEPPSDPRVNVIRVTPGPAAIEVSVQPAAAWAELRAIAEGLYEDAHNSGLGAERFMLDGRHTGAGGGKHVVLGAATAADSPFLRRPDLLCSLITYWQHHPALSYLFSGLLIGPGGRAPRADEARHDSLHELELAMKQLAQVLEPPPPSIVDRLLRERLVDVTGNPRHAEICTDKLYSPEGPAGQLGLVEFRAFEMPPHPRMSLVQELLLLALVARFWRAPYRHDLVRWGAQLHDRFMLPHFVWADLLDVIEDMNRAGYAFDAAWFAPHHEFRFPVCGMVTFGGIQIELRQALEPRLGAAGATVGDVDSSIERLQVKVRGGAHGRYLIACNGARVPLSPTGRADELVGGVRFRARQPVASERQAIAVDAPLVFDLYDRWSGRAVAGCTYHVTHPGGRDFTSVPASPYEAESRRLARFFAFGHTPGPTPAPPDAARAELPYTLDLRWTH